MFETIKNAFKVKEIRVKMLWTLLFLLLYRVGSYIPVPGVGDQLLSNEQLANTSYLNIMSMMTGGSLMNGTLFAMGIGPYINSSIIMQLLAVAIPPLERLSKQGEEGRRKISSYTRFLTILLAIIQSIGILVSYASNSGTGNFAELSAILAGGKENVTKFTTALSYIIIVLFYTAGSCITMWIGERITEHGISNGISLLIYAGIVASFATFVIKEFSLIFLQGSLDRTELWKFIAYLVIIVVLFAAIVWIELAERKVKVQYAKQVKGRKMYGGQSTEIPIKVNANGVMPLIFAFSILSFPELIGTLFGWQGFINWWQKWLGASSRYPFYSIVLCLLILFFAFFYSQIQFQPEDISKTIQQNGGFIPGIRPGKPTADYLKKTSDRLTLFGAIFLALLALIPSLILNAILPSASTSGSFSATGMLIVVSVALEFNTALESQIMAKKYKGFLK